MTHSWRVAVQAIAVVVFMLLLTAYLPTKNPVLLSLPSCFGAAAFFYIQQTDRQAGSASAPSFTPPTDLATIRSFLYPAVLCTASGIVTFVALNLASDSFMTTVQQLEAEKQITISDYGWRTVNITLNGLLALYIWLPASAYFAAKATSLLHSRPSYWFFVATSVVTFLSIALINYGPALFAGASLELTFGSHLNTAAPRDRLVYATAAVIMFAVLTAFQAAYMWLVGSLITKQKESGHVPC